MRRDSNVRILIYKMEQPKNSLLESTSLNVKIMGQSRNSTGNIPRSKKGTLAKILSSISSFLVRMFENLTKIKVERVLFGTKIEHIIQLGYFAILPLGLIFCTKNHF